MNKKRNILWICVMAVLMIAAAYYVFAYVGEAAEQSDKQELRQNRKLVKTIYSEDYQNQVEERLEAAKSSGKYTEESMLIEPNPYGTNTLSLYVYFQTEDNAKVSYSIHSEDQDIDEFSVIPESEKDYGTEHEFQVIGLVPGMKNTIVFTVENQDGTKETYEYTDQTGSVIGEEETQLEITEMQEGALEKLSDELYVILGNDSDGLDFMYYYDKKGVLRGEIPLIGYRSHRLLFQDGLMYYSISETKIAAMNSLGKIERIYDTGDYELHHDYAFDSENNLLILASDTKRDTVEDVVIRIDTESGDITGKLDLAELMGTYKEICETEEEEDLDWIHINTLQYLSGDTLILSSRETSSILKIQNAFSNPEIQYIIGNSDFWEGTGCESLLLAKDEGSGTFSDTGGQHTVTYVEDKNLGEGQYFLYMFNNNYGISKSRAAYDWNQVNGIETDLENGENSYYYKYLVDEDAGTYTLVSSFQVPFSAYVSSTQETEDGILIDSGYKGVFGVYESKGELQVQYKMELSTLYIYRVYQYDFHEFMEIIDI